MCPLPSLKCFAITDRAVEEEVASIGGALCNHSGQALEFFGCHVPAKVKDAWAWTGTSHPVFQAEMLAVLVSSHVWGPTLAHSLVSVLVDNASVKHALIRGSAHPESNQERIPALSGWSQSC